MRRARPAPLTVATYPKSGMKDAQRDVDALNGFFATYNGLIPTRLAGVASNPRATSMLLFRNCLPPPPHLFHLAA